MKETTSFLVVLVIVLSACPKDGIWDETKEGEERVIPCLGETIGPLIRRCRVISATESKWDDPDDQYCLPQYASKGMSNLDFMLSIPYSKPVVILKNPSGVVAALASILQVTFDQISVHRIAQYDQQETQIQIRISEREANAISLYNAIREEDAMKRIASFLLQNNEDGLRLYYFVNDHPSSIEILFAYGPLLNHAKAHYRPIIFLTLGVIVAMSLVTILALSYYIWRQYKRCRPQRQPHLITPSPIDVEELPMQYL